MKPSNNNLPNLERKTETIYCRYAVKVSDLSSRVMECKYKKHCVDQLHYGVATFYCRRALENE